MTLPRTTPFPICGLLLFAALLLAAQPVSAKGIAFETGGLAAAKAEARHSGKPLFVDAYTVWCGPCKFMAREIFPDKAVGDFYNENFVNIKLDMEKGEGLAFAEQYGVRSYPTFLFLDADGAILHRSVGAQGAEAFLKLGRTALDPEARLGGRKARYEQNPKDPDALRDYLLALYDARMSDDRLADEYRGLVKNEDDWFTKDNWQFIYRYVYKLEDPMFKFVVENRARFGALAGADEVSEYVENVVVGNLKSAYYSNPEEREANVQRMNARLREILPDAAPRYRAWGAFYALQLADQTPPEDELFSVAEAYVEHFHSSNELNEAAWLVYENCKKPAHLKAAAGWAKRSVEAEPAANNADTYMRLAFATGDYDAAEHWAGKCMAYAKAADLKELRDAAKAFRKKVRKARKARK